MSSISLPGPHSPRFPPRHPRECPANRSSIPSGRLSSCAAKSSEALPRTDEAWGKSPSPQIGGKIMGKLWEIYGKLMGNWCEIDGKFMEKMEKLEMIRKWLERYPSTHGNHIPSHDIHDKLWIMWEIYGKRWKNIHPNRSWYVSQFMIVIPIHGKFMGKSW